MYKSIPSVYEAVIGHRIVHGINSAGKQAECEVNYLDKKRVRSGVPLRINYMHVTAH